jgi:hypothetical protein
MGIKPPNMRDKRWIGWGKKDYGKESLHLGW